jgi:hypothetical protein
MHMPFPPPAPHINETILQLQNPRIAHTTYVDLVCALRNLHSAVKVNRWNEAKPKENLCSPPESPEIVETAD